MTKEERAELEEINAIVDEPYAGTRRYIHKRICIMLAHDPEELYYESQIAELRNVNADMYERLETAKAATALLDRMQEPRVFVLPDGHGLIIGGRQDGWLCFKHPDGQWVTSQKLQCERITHFPPFAGRIS